MLDAVPVPRDVSAEAPPVSAALDDCARVVLRPGILLMGEGEGVVAELMPPGVAGVEVVVEGVMMSVGFCDVVSADCLVSQGLGFDIFMETEMVQIKEKYFENLFFIIIKYL